MIRAPFARIALRVPLVFSLAGCAVALGTGLYNLNALRAYDRAPRSLVRSPRGPIVLDALVAVRLYGERLLQATGGEALLRDQDYDGLVKGAFDEAGPPPGTELVFIGCAEEDPVRRATRLVPCTFLPSTVRHDVGPFLDGLRENARRDFLALALAAAIASLWISSTWLAIARRRAGSDHVAEDSLETRLGLPLWIRVPEDDLALEGTEEA